MPSKLPDDFSIEHDAVSHRFRATLDGYEACLMYRLQGQRIDLYHTYVPEIFRGRGMAERLCKAAFEHAKQQQLTIVPSCSYISDYYVKRHPEYEPLIHRGPTSNPLVSG